MTTFRQRLLKNHLLNATTLFPVVLVIGARQVGKTTLLQEISESNRRYVTLDDPVVRSLAQEDPSLFLQKFSPPVVIDEIQYAPELLPLIKMIVDQEKKKGLYWLTGSQQFHLMQGVSESLAGRVAILRLLGLSLREGEEITAPFLPTKKQLEERGEKSSPLSLRKIYEKIWRGSYPAIALNKKMDRDLFYSSYVQTYLQRDIRDLANVGDERAFLRFLRAAAARTGNLLNFSDLARDADISAVTAKHWLSILESSGIVYLLQPYHNNVTKRVVKSPKLYFLDTGLSSYLTQWSTPDTLEAGAMSGAIFETAVITEILKSYWHLGVEPPLYFYRDSDKKEVDLLIVQDQTIYPIEINKTATPKKEHIKNFRQLDRLNHKRGRGGVICLSRELLPIDADNDSIPFFYV